MFSVNPPKTGQLWYGNAPINSESPFVAQYQDEGYKRIEEIQNNENQALNDYWIKQPELQEPEFRAQLQVVQDEEKNDPSKRVMHLWELGMYRLNKKIPSTLPFEERKELLIHSKEWNGWIHQNNKHLTTEEINEDNIQKEIENVGRQWGMELTKRYQPMEWIQLAMNSSICQVFIPQ